MWSFAFRPPQALRGHAKCSRLLTASPIFAGTRQSRNLLKFFSSRVVSPFQLVVVQRDFPFSWQSFGAPATALLLSFFAYTAQPLHHQSKEQSRCEFALGAGCRNKGLVNDTCVYSMLFTCFSSQLADPAALWDQARQPAQQPFSLASCLLEDFSPPTTPWVCHRSRKRTPLPWCCVALIAQAP